MTIQKLAAYVVIVLFWMASLAIADFEHSPTRYLPSLSFHDPFFPDLSSPIPNWEIGGDTLIQPDTIHLTFDIKDRRGFITTKRASTMKSVELTIAFRIWSSSFRGLGADGMAIWITQDKIVESGPVFGGPSKWNGLLITIDTFDNEGLRGNQHRISLHSNDGSQRYEMHSEGKETIKTYCDLHIRNFEISYFHFFYEEGRAQLYVDPEGKAEWLKCGEPFSANLPPSYFFAVSAATGGLSDNHDVYAFTVSTMDPAASQQQHEQKPESPEEPQLQPEASTNFYRLTGSLKSLEEVKKPKNSDQSLTEKLLSIENQIRKDSESLSSYEEIKKKYIDNRNPEPLQEDKREPPKGGDDEQATDFFHKLADNVSDLLELVASLGKNINLIHQQQESQTKQQKDLLLQMHDLKDYATASFSSLNSNQASLPDSQQNQQQQQQQQLPPIDISSIERKINDLEQKIESNQQLISQSITQISSILSSFQDTIRTIPVSVSNTITDDMKHVSSSINGAIEMSAKRLVTEFEQKLHKVENAISSTKEPVQGFQQDILRVRDSIGELSANSSNSTLIYAIVVMQFIILLFVAIPKVSKNLVKFPSSRRDKLF